MKKIPLSHRIVSIERAMPRVQTRNEHPKCDDCTDQAEFTLETRDIGGNGGYLDLCSAHLENRLNTEPGFASRAIMGLIRDRLKE